MLHSITLSSVSFMFTSPIRTVMSFRSCFLMLRVFTKLVCWLVSFDSSSASRLSFPLGVFLALCFLPFFYGLSP